MTWILRHYFQRICKR